MFRVGAFVSIALIVSMFLGCSDETTEAEPTGLEIGFQNCLSFNTQVFVDGNYVGSYSSERDWFIDVPSGNHVLEAHANLVVVAGDTSFCWTEDFSVSDANVTHVELNCSTAGCPIP
jgi:hypothetical protein